jgi:hypothetical protein
VFVKYIIAFDYGFLPLSLFRQVQERFAAYAAGKRMRTIPRTA